MTVELRLAGWEARGLRCPDHKVSFERTAGDVHPISLLQMPNGTGKTTTLLLLRAALSGIGPGGGWTPESIREMKKHRDTQEGMFQAVVLHDGQRVTFRMQFDFEESSVRYLTTVPTGQKHGFEPPRELARFLNPSFVDFFVFDGELADSLLDKDRTNAQRVIDDLFQLTLFERMAAWVDSYWKDHAAEKAKTANTSSTTEKGLKKWRGWIDRCEKRLYSLKSERTSVENKQRALGQRLQKLRAESDAALTAKAEHGKKVAAAEEALRQAEDRVQQLAVVTLQRARDPHAMSSVFAEEMLTLKGSLDRVKLPESAARDFFEELAEEDDCVCGRPLDDDSRMSIRERAAKYLGSDDVALLNNMKSEVGTQIGADPKASARQMDRLLQELQDAIRQESERRTERDAIKAEAIHEDPLLEKKEKEIDGIKKELVLLDKEMERFDDLTDTAEIEDTWGIAEIESRLQKARNAYAQISNTLMLKARCDTLGQIIGRARIQAREGISAAICEETNRRILQLMPHNLLRVQRVDKCLRFGDEKGGGSAGETLAVAYAFLSTLFHRTEYQLPFVVDSPAGPLDHPKRSAVAVLIPRLAGQFVAFVISTEREAFQDRLQSAATSAIQYLTMFRRGDPALERAASREATVESTEDGMLVHGREFFEGFQLETEESDAVPSA